MMIVNCFLLETAVYLLMVLEPKLMKSVRKERVLDKLSVFTMKSMNSTGLQISPL